MEIRIEVDTAVPLVGRAHTADGRSIEFTGWLGLLQVLSEMVPAAGA